MKHGLSKETVTDSDESGSESSRSSSPAKEVSKIEKKKQRKEKSDSKSKSKKKAPAPKPDSSSSESESESESSSESESERETPKDQGSKKSSGKRVTIQESTETVPPIPAKAYKPPEGFQFLKKASTQSNPVPNAFSNLDGKQIWHITAPLSVPVSSIEQLALESVASGEPILTHKGVKYRLHEDPLGAEKTKSLLLPDKHGNVFRRNRRGVAQTFHVEQVVDLPNGDLSVTPDDINTLKKKTPKQPKNLRMRYKPFGSSNEQPEMFGSASEESEAETRSSKKRKHGKVDSSVQDESHKEPKSPDELTRKKSKKTSSEVPNSSAHITKSSKKDAKKKGREEKQQSPELRKKHREETSPERRARREERKRKKQQK